MLHYTPQRRCRSTLVRSDRSLLCNIPKRHAMYAFVSHKHYPDIPCDTKQNITIGSSSPPFSFCHLFANAKRTLGYESKHRAKDRDDGGNHHQRPIQNTLLDAELALEQCEVEKAGKDDADCEPSQRAQE